MISAMWRLALPAVGLLFNTQVWAQPVPLVEDVSRGLLGEYEVSQLSGADKDIVRNFIFPDNANDDGVYGIDVSHHNGPLKWPIISEKNIVFAVAKATQGTDYYDKTFDDHWKDMAAIQKTKSGFVRGAYHFLSADGIAEYQARNYLNTLKSNGGLSDSDMAPIVDLEWDARLIGGRIVLDANGKAVDKWAAYSGPAIVGKVSKWLQIVKEATGRRPIIYTSAAWWSERIGDNASLNDYKLWIADYSKSSIENGAPKMPKGYQYVMWQFTDRGTVTGGHAAAGTVDVNFLKVAISDLTKSDGH